MLTPDLFERLQRLGAGSEPQRRLPRRGAGAGSAEDDAGGADERSPRDWPTAAGSGPGRQVGSAAAAWLVGDILSDNAARAVTFGWTVRW